MVECSEVRNIKTFGEVMEIVSRYLNSRHLTLPSMRNDDGPADMDVGALKGRQEGKEEKGSIEKVSTKEEAQGKERTKARNGKREGCKE